MNISVSVGELVDKLTILEIKLSKISDNKKLLNVRTEYNTLTSQHGDFKHLDLYDELYQINQALWDIEDLIRIKEKNKEFDQGFIDLARNVYITNDKRFMVKTAINKQHNSFLVEEKSYENY